MPEKLSVKVYNKNMMNTCSELGMQKVFRFHTTLKAFCDKDGDPSLEMLVFNSHEGFQFSFFPSQLSIAKVVMSIEVAQVLLKYWIKWKYTTSLFMER